MKTVEQYWRKHEWAKPHSLKLDNCPIDTNVGGDCKELIDSTDFIIQSMECHGGNKQLQSKLVEEAIHVMEIWYFG